MKYRASILLLGLAIIVLTGCKKESATARNFDVQGNLLVYDTLSFINHYDAAGQFLWKFGDGDSTTEYSPKHAFTRPGAYTVKLISLVDGEQFETSKLLTIKIDFSAILGMHTWNRSCFYCSGGAHDYTSSLEHDTINRAITMLNDSVVSLDGHNFTYYKCAFNGCDTNLVSFTSGSDYLLFHKERATGKIEVRFFYGLCFYNEQSNCSWETIDM